MDATHCLLECEKHGGLFRISLVSSQEQRDHIIKGHMNAHLRAYSDCKDKIKITLYREE